MVKIFICDDDDGIVDMVKLILTHAGFDVITETDSLKAFGRIKNLQPTLVIVDLWMPKLPGADLIKILRGDNDLKELAIMGFSASPDGKRIAMDAGADCFIQKPFDIKDFLSTIANCLDRNEVSNQLIGEADKAYVDSSAE